MIKVKLKRFIAMTMVFCLTILPSNAFATEIDLENSSVNVNKHGTVTKDSGSDTFDDETTNVWQNGEISEEVRVNVDVASSFTITIPKEIVLNGNDGSATYKVKCEGDIAGDQVITIVPDNSFTLYEDGGKETPVTVTQPDTDFTYQKIDAGNTYDGDLSASEISAGNWSGKFNFNIEFKANSSPTLPAKTFNEYTWAEIAAISEAGNAASTFSVGDEKELTIGSKTYHVQILGFDHDDLSDGTGKAGITVGLKEVMTTTRVMNSTKTNVGGWRDSEMRTYLKNNVLSSLPNELQSVIKTVNKVSDVGNQDTTTLKTTEDKLFLLSTTEVGGNSYTSWDVDGQGMQYEFFTDNASRIKYLNIPERWWLRSTSVYGTIYFGGVDSDGSYNGGIVNEGHGVSFAFCI